MAADKLFSESIWEDQIPPVGQQTEVGGDSGTDGEGDEVVSSLTGCSSPSHSEKSERVVKTGFEFDNRAGQSSASIVHPDSLQQEETVTTSSETCGVLKEGTSSAYSDQGPPLTRTLVCYDSSDSDDSSVKTPTIENCGGQGTHHSMSPLKELSGIECEALNTETWKGDEDQPVASYNNGEGYWNEDGCWVDSHGQVWQPPEGYWQQEWCPGTEREKKTWHEPTISTEIVVVSDNMATVGQEGTGQQQWHYQSMDNSCYNQQHSSANEAYQPSYPSRAVPITRPQTHNTDYSATSSSDGNLEFESSCSDAEEKRLTNLHYDQNQGILKRALLEEPRMQAQTTQFSWHSQYPSSITCSRIQATHFSSHQSEIRHYSENWSHDALSSSPKEGPLYQNEMPQRTLPPHPPLIECSTSLEVPLLDSHIPCTHPEPPTHSSKYHSNDDSPSLQEPHPHFFPPPPRFAPYSWSLPPQPVKTSPYLQKDVASCMSEYRTDTCNHDASLGVSSNVSSTTRDITYSVDKQPHGSNTSDHCGNKTIFSDHLRDPRRPHHLKSKHRSSDEHVSENASTSSLPVKELDISVSKKIGEGMQTSFPKSRLSGFRIPKHSDKRKSDCVTEAKSVCAPSEVKDDTCVMSNTEVAVIEKLFPTRSEGVDSGAITLSSQQDLVTLFKGLDKDALSTLASSIHLVLDTSAETAVGGIEERPPSPSSTTIESDKTACSPVHSVGENQFQEIETKQVATAQNESSRNRTLPTPPSTSRGENVASNTSYNRKPLSSSSPRTVLATILSPMVAKESQMEEEEFTVCIPIARDVKFQVVKTNLNERSGEDRVDAEDKKEEYSLSKAPDMMFDPKFMYKEYNLRKLRKDVLHERPVKQLHNENTALTAIPTTSDGPPTLKRGRVNEAGFSGVAPQPKRNKTTTCGQARINSSANENDSTVSLGTEGAALHKKQTFVSTSTALASDPAASSILGLADKCSTKCPKNSRFKLFCSLCKLKGGVSNLGYLFGPYFYPEESECSASTQDTEEVWLHEDCAVWASGISLIGRQLSGLKEAMGDANKMMCAACKKMGAALLCNSRGCKNIYHFPCAIDRGCLLIEENFKMSCPRHKNVHT